MCIEGEEMPFRGKDAHERAWGTPMLFGMPYKHNHQPSFPFFGNFLDIFSNFKSVGKGRK